MEFATIIKFNLKLKDLFNNSIETFDFVEEEEEDCFELIWVGR